ncbi:inverse autotransporter beta domain-containing protein [Lelliottia amnigena]|uniref:Ig-like domain-containing protein n=1 Tax=Lelliottia TaxID=1330545 RepID=UPI00192A8EB4|nr:MULTISPECIES: inverse autotransporter beta domain-containing protein [Lelliottia]MBL5884888.1 inverse autotransporter beta domain-containing protein [Lelliottia aquatilis]MBL5923875.1 inverse autotransporter beta domain-containing protein [Lelliottia amnigena]MBL5932720.1 inverse autotransporter beta domain-containing protein [Lelliottia amnigena]
MSTRMKLVLALLLAFQILFIMMPSHAGDDPAKNGVLSSSSANDLPVAVTTLAGAAQEGSLPDTAIRMSSNEAASLIQSWLSYSGTARVNLELDNDFSLDNSSVDVLYPFLKSEHRTFFTQLGLRDNDGYITTNLGGGQRFFGKEWGLGYNLFWDATWNSPNHRLGVGGEALHDYMKLSVNAYQGISGWHSSSEYTDYDERPADGWDIRAEGWLPHYPQLGGRLMLEQYYGDEVALIGHDDRTKNPFATTVGINYTPVPMVTLGTEMKNVKSGHNEAMFTLAFTFNPGMSLQKQMTPDSVSSLRSLTGQQLDLVSRNNNVLLDYRKQNVLSLIFPARIMGEELSTFDFTPVIKSKYHVDNIKLNDTQLVKAGGRVISATPQKISLQLPPFSSQPVILSGYVIDNHGNKSELAESEISVTVSQRILNITADKNNVIADGYDFATLKVNVSNVQGSGVANEYVSFSTDDGVLSSNAGTTDQNGNVTVFLRGTDSGIYHVTATSSGQKVMHDGVNFISSLSGNLTVDKLMALADGTDRVKFTLILKNSLGEEIPDRQVNWRTTGGELTANSTRTDPHGQTTVYLSSKLSGESLVTASVGNQQFLAPNVKFTDNQPHLSIFTSKSVASADGADFVTVTLTSRDMQGAPLPGAAVQWSTDLGTLSATETITSEDGISRVNLSSLQEGETTVTADVRGEKIRTSSIIFNKVLQIKVEADKPQIAANGEETAELTAFVSDMAGQPLSGIKVDWSSTAGALSELYSITDKNGRARNEIRASQAGNAMITAKAGRQEANTDIVFLASELNMMLGLSSDAETIIADGKDVANITATVTDTNGKGLEGLEVTITAPNAKPVSSTSVTDSNGIVKVTLTAEEAGDILITANTGTVSEKLTITAISPSPEVILATATAVDNSGTNVNNVSFGTKSPLYAWPGAKIRLSMPGAKGPVKWSSDLSGVTIEDDVLTFNTAPGEMTINGKDSEGKKAVYQISLLHWISYISDFAAFYGEPGYVGLSAYGTCTDKGAKVLTLGVYHAIYKEWGNLYNYNGWKTAYYHTSTPYGGSDPHVSNYYFWGEDGSAGKNRWGMLNFACE